MDDEYSKVHRFHGVRPFSLDDEAMIDFLGIGEGMKVLDVGGADGYYSKKFIARGSAVTLVDAYDYNFSELNALGINTIMRNFCSYSESNFDLVFMAHVYHDLVHTCKAKTLENLSKISLKYIGNLDFTKEDFGFGPPISEKLEKEEVVSDMRSIGFMLKKDMDLQYHYLQLFKRNEIWSELRICK
jgi:hypothetical protein